MDYKKIMAKINENIFITSDHHFQHSNLLKYEPIREKIQIDKGISIEEYMIEQWNKVVGENDIVLHLGDFAWRDLKYWSSRLNGEKIIIRGNHDHGKTGVYQKSGWKVIDNPIIYNDNNLIKLTWKGQGKKPKLRNSLIINISNFKILFSHIPAFDDNIYDKKFAETRTFLSNLFNENNCDINIHGHTHGNTPNCKRCVNVSVEKTNFKPIKIKNILERINKNKEN